MKGMHVIGIAALAAILATGCSAKHAEEVNLAQGRGMYSALDATAQVYSNPMAQAPVEDNPWRWAGYAAHPIGVALDYVFNRPFSALASTFPDIFGYTSEDAMISSQRRK